MKIVIYPLLGIKTFDCNYFTPKYYFEPEWCLDMHGFLSRDELKVRLDEINRIVDKNPLLSERTKKALLYALLIITFIIFLFFLIMFKSLVYSHIALSVAIQVFTITCYIVGRYLVNEEARRRTEKFSFAMTELFNQYNVNDNPTANWKLKWRKVHSYCRIEMNTKYSLSDFGKTKNSNKAKIIPMFAEQAEIELEINDALSNITECTVRLNLCKLGKLDRIVKNKFELEKLVELNDKISITVKNKKLPKIPVPPKEVKMFNYPVPLYDTMRRANDHYNYI